VNRTGARIPLLLSCLALLAVSAAPAQTREQMRQQAETQLRQMTPEEIDQRLKELGLTREEAMQKAKEFGIDLEEFLIRGQAATAPATTTAPTATFRGDPRLSIYAPPELHPVRVDTIVRPPRPVNLRAFSGRPGIDSLIRPFGFDIFQMGGPSFEPSLSAAPPSSYALGPGDEVVIALWGETRLTYQTTVNREGNVVLPDVGPISATGQTLQQFRDKALRRLSSVYSGLRSGAPNATTALDVSLGKLRMIQIFVLGEVTRPGAYTVSSLSTVMHALYAAGGPTADGSLRMVRVNRTGDSLASSDLYNYLLRGDRSQDRHLQDGDVVFVPPAGKRAAVIGEVVRPAVYELRDDESLGALLGFAGGLRVTAYAGRIHIERLVPFEQRVERGRGVEEFDVRFGGIEELRRSTATLADGDIATVLRMNALAQNRVSISGNVRNPGPFQLLPGMRVRDLVLQADSLDRNTFMERGTLFHLLPNLRREVSSFNLHDAMEGVESQNPPLFNEDSVVIYRESQFRPEHPVSITGAVRNPGSFTRNEGMTVADLVVLAGGLREDATTEGWEISRMETTKVGVYSRILRVSLPPDYWALPEGQGEKLEDFDVVFVPSDPRYTKQKTVQLTGYVMYPGVYTIRYAGEKLADLFQRAGGLRQGAYLEGSRLIRRFNNAGLVPLDFQEALQDPGSRDNVAVYDGDSIHVAYVEDVVYVSGEVFVPSPVLYKKGASLSYYIDQAGGYKEEADEGRTVVLLPGGKKWNPGWFIIPDPEILPGSSVFAPKKIEKPDTTLPLIRDLAMILASMAAITVALVQVTK
jgi:polysaccharide export outer membrane protein